MNKSHLFFFSAAILLALIGLAQFAAPATRAMSPQNDAAWSSNPRASENAAALPQAASGVVLVGLKSGTTMNAPRMQSSSAPLNTTFAQIGVRRVEPVFPTIRNPRAPTSVKGLGELSNIYRLRLAPNANVPDAIKKLQANPAVAYAEPDYLAHIIATPNDPQFGSQWGLAKINAPAAWDVTTGSSDIVVAVIDAGVNVSHPDLAAQLWTNPGEIAGNGLDDDSDGFVDDVRGWNFVDSSADLSDNTGHGTEVAGVIAAATNNSTGIAGMCWQCKLMIVKVVQPGGAANYSDIAAGVAYAAQKGAKVINISLGGSSDSITLKTAIATAAQSAVIVAGAGNDNGEAAFYPAAYDDYVLAVAGTTNTDTKVATSNYGTWVDVSAPGENILTTFNNGGYGSASGTSMAAPFASGLAGLIRSQHADWSANQVRAQIIQTTDNIDAANPGLAGKLGSGRVNANKAVTTAAQPLLTIKTYTANGMQNGRPEPDSAVDLIITLRNDWANAANAQATLSSSSGYVSISAANASYGNIASFETKSNATAFRFNVLGSAPYNTNLAFNLNVTGTGFNVNIPLTIPTAPGITYVHGTLNTQTWTSDRTYIVDNNAGVPAGQTLTIQPGTTIKFRDNYTLQIGGTLIADGTAAQPIRFTREVTKTWGQIKFTNTSAPATFDGSGNYTGGSIIRRAIVEYGQGVYLDTAAPFISNNMFQNMSGCTVLPCTGGGTAISGNPVAGLVISDNTFNGTGVYLNSLPWVWPPSGSISILRNQLTGATINTQATAIIIDNSISDCSGQGIYAANYQATNMVVSNNRVVGCTEGIVANAGNISGNLVANSTTYGLRVQASMSAMPGYTSTMPVTVTNNTLVNNNLAGLYIDAGTMPGTQPPPVIAHNNNLVAGAGGYALKVGTTYTLAVDATGNYWGTTNDAAIQAAIYDGMDEFGPGIVNYAGYLSDAVQTAPPYVQNVTVQPDTTLGIQTGTFTAQFSRPMNQSGNPSASFSSSKKGSWTTFTLPDALGGGMINAIAIDRDDSKWIAGMYGIGRFDGSAWTVYTSTNPISMTGRTLTGISAIAVDNNGTKWFGTAWSILSFNGSTWTVYDCGASTFPCSGSTLTGIVVDNANVKWLGLSVPTGMPGSELVSFDGTTWRTYNTSNSGLPNNSVSTIAVDKDGAKWIGTYGGVARFDGTTWTVYNASNSALPGDQITAIAIDKDGIKWISANTMSNPRVVRFDGASWTIYDSLGWVNHIAVDVDNSKWFVTSSGMGLARYDGTTWTNYNSSNSPGMPSWINRITIDASGNKWTGANAPSGGIAVMWGGANYPITDNAQWTTNRTWRGTYDITSLIDRGTYTITVGSALGTDGMLIAPDSRFGFRVDYAGTITDKTPPNPPVVFATGAPGDPSAASANWTTTGVAYRYAIGTAPGAADIVNWTSASGATASKTGLGLVNGRQYWFAAQARNAGGLWSASGYGAFVAGQQSNVPLFLPLVVR